MKTLLAVFALFSGPVLFGAEPVASATYDPAEFSAIVRTGQDQIFLLRDPATKEVTGHSLGESWRGWRVQSFDADTQRLTLTREGAELVLRLRPRPLANAAAPFTFVPGSPGVPTLLQGTSAVQDGRIVYSPEARLQLSNGWIVSSGTGKLSADHEQKIIAGDLVIEQPGGKIIAGDDGTLDTVRHVFRAKTMRYTSAPGAAK